MAEYRTSNNAKANSQMNHELMNIKNPHPEANDCMAISLNTTTNKSNAPAINGSIR